LVGHSMGGKIALALAARAPGGLAGVLLLAPSPPSPEPMTDEVRTRLLNSYGDRDAIEVTISQITANPLPAAIYERTVEDNLKSARPAWQAWLESGSRENIQAQMPNIEVPVWVVAGAEDKAITPAVLQREIVEKLAQASLHVMPDAGHLIPLEKPAETIHFISEMLAEM